MGIDEFNKFPLPEPPLIEDPFTSLSTSKLVAMEASTAATNDGREYKGDDEDINE
jgi:hypothetical protein